MKPERALAGRCALVTGAAKRLGAAISLALARAGADVLLHYRASESEVEALCLRCREQGVRAEMIKADLTDTNEAAGLAERAAALLRAPDILVNNASVFPSEALADMSEESLFLNIRVNALAPFVIARAFAGRAQNGVVVNLLDSRIVESDRAHAAYHLSKRSLATLTRMMALEFAPAVRVNAVAPGLILPPEGKDEKYFDALIKNVPLARHGEPDDVAEAVLFLINAGFVTGQVIFVDGGARMKGDVYGW